MKIVAGTFSACNEPSRPAEICWNLARSLSSPTTGPSSIVMAMRRPPAGAWAETEHRKANASTAASGDAKDRNFILEFSANDSNSGRVSFDNIDWPIARGKFGIISSLGVVTPAAGYRSSAGYYWRRYQLSASGFRFQSFFAAR